VSELKSYIEIPIAVCRLLFLNLDLAYYYLPRSWRGGYKSPWEQEL
jgi:hypothetical protein